MKEAYVTTGATSPYERLVLAVLSTRFITALATAGFSKLTVQHGTFKPNREFKEALVQGTAQGVQISFCEYDSSLAARMARSQLVFSHGGAGCILDAVRVGPHPNGKDGRRVVVVPNNALKDAHQRELAHAFADMGLVECIDIEGGVDELVDALVQVVPTDTTNLTTTITTTTDTKNCVAHGAIVESVVSQELYWRNTLISRHLKFQRHNYVCIQSKLCLRISPLTFQLSPIRLSPIRLFPNSKFPPSPPSILFPDSPVLVRQSAHQSSDVFCYCGFFPLLRFLWRLFRRYFYIILDYPIRLYWEN